MVLTDVDSGKEYFQLGYVPYPESMGSSAQTMEYAYDDFCGYQLAKMVEINITKYLPVRCTTIKMSLISLSIYAWKGC